MRRLLAAILLIEVVLLLGCEGGGTERPVPAPSRVSETATPPPPPAPGAQFSTQASVTVHITETGAVEYVSQLELTETAGVRATVTDAVLEFASFWDNRSYPFGPEIWIGGGVVSPLGTLRSRPIVVREDFPWSHHDQLYVRLSYIDAASTTAKSLGIGASIPPIPDPPPGARLTVIGTVMKTGQGIVPGATVTVLKGHGAGRTATTNEAGEYRLTDLKPGDYSLEVSKPGYTTTGFDGSLLSSMTWNLVFLD